jgi:histone-lysine N-methyltransferase SETMAR
MDNEVLESLLRADPRQSTRDLAEQLCCSPTTVERHLHELGKVQKYGAWLPHELSDTNTTQRVTTCVSLLSPYHNDPFLDRIITGDEKWVLYVNVHRKRQWVGTDEKSEPDDKSDLHPKKVLLCIWWDVHGVVYFEVLNNQEVITAELYSKQLQRLHEALLEKRPTLINRKNVILQHDARPHVAKLTLEKFKELKGKVLAHSPYSPDIAPSDFYLFRSLQHHLKEKHYQTEDDISAFFTSKSSEFFKRGIAQLPSRWATIVENNGAYINE